MARTTIQKPESLTMLVAKHLRRAIIEADLKLGEVLSEDKIAASLNVSRTPVREALGLLQMQGLIEVVPQKGSFVFLPSSRDIAALAEYRVMLEQQAGTLALARAPEATLKDMQKALTLMEKARVRKDAIGYARADDLFHLAAFEHCDNPYLKDGYNSVSGRIAALRCHLSGPLKLFQNQTLGEHQAMAQAVDARDLAALLKGIRAHIEGMQANYMRAIDDGLVQVPRKRPRLKGPRRGQPEEVSDAMPSVR